MYMKAKLRGVVVMFALVGMATLFGWSENTLQTVITFVFGIGAIFFFIAVIRKLTGNG
jgi:hypothetical protein